MASEYKTLEDIWNENRRCPVRVKSSGGKKGTLIELHCERGFVKEDGSTAKNYSCLAKEWKVIKYALKPHWPTIREMYDPTLPPSTILKGIGPFHTKESCPKGSELLTNYPSVMLEVEE